MRKINPDSPLYEYQLRIPEDLREEGWYVRAIAKGSGDPALYRADLGRDGHDDTVLSESWMTSESAAVDSAISRIPAGERD